MPSFSLRNPHFVIVGTLITALLGLTAFAGMPVDVFPNLKIPAVVVGTFYPGMPPQEVERDITTRFERFFTLGNDIEHIESRSLPGVSIIKVFFQPTANVDAAASQLANLAMADLRHLPPGTLPPIVLKSDASSLPVTLVTVSGAGFSEAQLRDQAQYNVRNQLATVAGASVPPPFGGKYRQVMVYVNREALEARGLTLMDVVHSVNDSNLIIPAGDAKIGSTDYFVNTNSLIEEPEQTNDVPIKVGAGQAPVFVRDVGQAADAAQIQQNVVRIDGQRSVYVPILKQGNANTIAVVDGVRSLLPKLVGLPDGMKLDSIFDQSGYIRQAIESLEHEAGLAAVLASLVILLFLGSFKSTVAIFLSIPLSLLAAAFGLYMNGSTINVMTLGGFALAIGRLVDDSVVVLESVNRHLEQGKTSEQAARDGAEEVALPVLASTLTTVIVFFPVMFLFGVAKYLFSALSLSVVLAMLASYVVAMTVIPIFCARFLTAADAHAEHDGERRGAIGVFQRVYERFAARYERFLERALDHKWTIIGSLSAAFVITLGAYRLLGTELFPRTDAGQFIVNLRTPRGSRIEVTEALTEKIEGVIREVIPADDLSMIVSNLGLAPGFSALYSSNAASDSGFMLVSLKEGHRLSTWHYISELRAQLPELVPEVQTFFQSGSIIDAVLNFGLAAPIDVQLSGPHYTVLHEAAQKVDGVVRGLPEVADTFIPQESGYPTLDVKVDRVKAARLGLSQKDVVSNTITALTSNQMIAPSIWIDPKTGNDYFLTVQYPERDIRSIETLLDIPVRSSSKDGGEDALLLRNVASISKRTQPAEVAHYNIQRVVDVLVAPRGDDMGGTQAAIQRALAGLELPKDVQITYRGSVSAMQSSFSSFGFGLAMAILLLYLVMVAQFRSFLDPFIIMFAVPMGLIGVVWTLLATETTLNIESFMGTIVMVGIVVSNSILLVDFANQRRREGAPVRRAVVDAARIRMRPILMTALATVVGLLPIALKLGAGSEASAPLARAAAGGLTVSTVLTLVLVPAVYELFYTRREGAQ
ncbi:MAG TPA: efflux RND transporter permease subunit [Myxococcota bacterium]|nr:efflux RND transporter permease subunit [Myxococcota bacterium]